MPGHKINASHSLPRVIYKRSYPYHFFIKVSIKNNPSCRRYNEISIVKLDKLGAIIVIFKSYYFRS